MLYEKGGGIAVWTLDYAIVKQLVSQKFHVIVKMKAIIIRQSYVSCTFVMPSINEMGILYIKKFS
jgi:hypothetical protein